MAKYNDATDQLDETTEPNAPDQAGTPDTPEYPQDQPDQASPEGRGGAQDGNDQGTPGDRDRIKRIGMAAQEILANPQYNKQIVEMASANESGLMHAADVILTQIVERSKMPPPAVAEAAVIVMVVLLDFLSSIKRFKMDAKVVGNLIGKFLTAIQPKYNIPPEVIQQMTQSAPSQMRPGMNAGNAAKPSGLLGRMMGRV